MKNKEDLYAKWLSGEISDDELQSAEGAEALSELKRIAKSVDSWSMPKYDTTSGYKKFKLKHQAVPVKSRKINWFAISSIAACFLITAVFWNTFKQDQNQVLFASNGNNQSITLNDGTEISLNDGSKIEYNNKKWIDKRIINLSGEALFQVSKGSPFTVETQNGSVQVLGTQFNVRAWGENLYVECYEGSVKVTAEGKETILTAHEAVNVIEGNLNEKQKIENIAPAWQNGMSRFYNEQLEVVFEEIERQYNITVNRKKAGGNFSGNFGHDNLENALRNICKPLGLTFTISKDQKTVVIE